MIISIMLSMFLNPNAIRIDSLILLLTASIRALDIPLSKVDSIAS